MTQVKGAKAGVKGAECKLTMAKIPNLDLCHSWLTCSSLPAGARLGYINETEKDPQNKKAPPFQNGSTPSHSINNPIFLPVPHQRAVHPLIFYSYSTGLLTAYTIPVRPDLTRSQSSPGSSDSRSPRQTGAGPPDWL